MPVIADDVTTLPYELRYQAISYENTDGTMGETRCPINYEELYNLKGRLLTLIDATFSDPEQRKAHKSVVWQALTGWMTDIEEQAQAKDVSMRSLDAALDVPSNLVEGP